MIYRWYVKDVLLFHECTDVLIQGNNKTCLFGTKDFTSGILAVKLDAGSYIKRLRFVDKLLMSSARQCRHCGVLQMS